MVEKLIDSLPMLPSLRAGETSAPLRGLRDRLSLALATCGVGYIPIVPATWASAVTTGVYWTVLQMAGPTFTELSAEGSASLSPEVLRVTFMLVVIVALTFAGVWAASRVERLLRRKDPKPVVIDEVVGQLVTLLFVPRAAGLGMLVVGFFVFRAFDILKPYPIRRLESLGGGTGVMADDILAGVYGAILMLLILHFFASS
jgi:phosphatidylglycerophosphatase A